MTASAKAAKAANVTPFSYNHDFPNSSGTGPSQTSGKPGIAVCHGEMYVAWTGNASPYHMLISHTTNPFSTGSWSTPQVLNDTAYQPTGPALACFLNQLYIAWAGTNSAHNLNVGYYTDGNAALHNKTTLSQSSTNTPDLAPSSADGKLYLVWRGRDNANLYLSSSSGGTTWAGSTEFGDTSPLGPSIGEALFDGQYREYVAWQSTGNTQTIYTGYYDGSSALQDHHNTGLAIDNEPDLASVGSTLYLVYVSFDTLYQYRSTDGLYWSEAGYYIAPAGIADLNRVSVAEDGGYLWAAIQNTSGQVGVGEIPTL